MPSLEEIEKRRDELDRLEREEKERIRLVKKKEWQARLEEEKQELANFRESLELVNRVKGHPKAALLWELAFEEGHDNGLDEVEHYYQLMVRLIQ